VYVVHNIDPSDAPRQQREYVGPNKRLKCSKCHCYCASTVQCARVEKNLKFSDIFFQTVGIFQSKFYTPIIPYVPNFLSPVQPSPLDGGDFTGINFWLYYRACLSFSRHCHCCQVCLWNATNVDALRSVAKLSNSQIVGAEQFCYRRHVRLNYRLIR